MGCTSSKDQVNRVDPSEDQKDKHQHQPQQQLQRATATNKIEEGPANQPLSARPVPTTAAAGHTPTLAATTDRLQLRDLHDDFVRHGDLNGTVVRFEAALGTPIDDVYEGFRDGEPLGVGAFGVVRKATHRATGTQYAVKCMQLNQFPGAAYYQQLREEIRVMCQLDHPSIVRIKEVYESFDELFIVQELCEGGDLFDRLEKQLDEAYDQGLTGLPFSEAQCAEYVQQMLAATQYLHSKGIVHRDLKLEHFMFATPESSELRMIDFGLSKHLDASGFVCGRAGTTYTKAPEVLQGGRYNEKYDVWSIGILTFLLLAGDTPFGSLDDEDSRKSINCKEAISHGNLVFVPAEKWDLVSNEGKHFIRRLLQRDPAQRPSAAEAMEDPWIVDWARRDANLNQQLSSRTLTSLIAFKESSEMQRLLSEVLSYTLLPEQISGLRGEFMKIDKTGTGVITLASLKLVLMQSTKGSFGGLTEHDVEEIFDSIKMSKTESTIRWHEFLAAGVSNAKYDDRNMRLAFERLDTMHHGFLTVEDLADVLGNGNGVGTLEDIWRSCIKDFKIGSDRITYDDFAYLIKGRSGPLVLPAPKETAAGNIPLATVSEECKTSRDEVSETDSCGARTQRQNNESGALPAHIGDEFDGLLKVATNSPLIANRSLYRMNRELFLPTMVDLMDSSRHTVSKPGRKGREKARSCPSCQAGLVMKHGFDSPEARAHFDEGSKRIGLSTMPPKPMPIARAKSAS